MLDKAFTGLSPRCFGKLVTAMRREGADVARRGRPWSLSLEDRVLWMASVRPVIQRSWDFIHRRESIADRGVIGVGEGLGEGAGEFPTGVMTGRANLRAPSR